MSNHSRTATATATAGSVSAEHAVGHVIGHATLVTLATEGVAPEGSESSGQEQRSERSERLSDGALVVSGGRIVWTGAHRELPERYARWPRTDVGHRLVTPSLIDCHTHVVYGGSRVEEFELRLLGASYEDLARAGGGILSTVRATRAASDEQLFESAAQRLTHLRREGVGTVEIKSGYGLDLPTELRTLRVARQLGSELAGLQVRTTLLAAHAVPPEYSGRADAYVDLVCEEIIPRAHEEDLVDQVDVFSESIAFDLSQTERVFRTARDLGLDLRVHAEQLSDSGAARLAARYGARSADHLECLNPSDCDDLAAAGTVAVLLPGAFYSLRETRIPPIEALRAAGVPLAVATDWNPGSSPLGSVLLAMNMACTLFRLTPREALAGTTRVAARVLGLEEELGTLEPGKRAEFLVWDLEDPAELSYRIAGHAPPRRWCGSGWLEESDAQETRHPGGASRR